GSIYHVIATFKSNDKIQLFLNGTLQSSMNISHLLDIPNGPTIKLGRTTESFDGPANAKIFVARIYNRVLSSSEVLQNFNAQKARFGL
ncbi:MAG: LamG-like jellyroll fold domain-containing protein, partial [Bacteroidota bacterium]